MCVCVCAHEICVKRLIALERYPSSGYGEPEAKITIFVRGNSRTRIFFYIKHESKNRYITFMERTHCICIQFDIQCLHMHTSLCSYKIVKHTLFIIGHIVCCESVCVRVFSPQISCFLIAVFSLLLLLLLSVRSKIEKNGFSLASGAHQHDYVFIRMGMARIVHLWLSFICLTCNREQWKKNE